MAIKKQEVYETRSGRLIMTKEEAIAIDKEEGIASLMSYIATAYNDAEKVEAVLKYVIDEMPSPCTNKQLRLLIDTINEEYKEEN